MTSDLILDVLARQLPGHRIENEWRWQIDDQNVLDFVVNTDIKILQLSIKVGMERMVGDTEFIYTLLRYNAFAELGTPIYAFDRQSRLMHLCSTHSLEDICHGDYIKQAATTLIEQAAEERQYWVDTISPQ
jgi:hypothetical protein